MTDKRFEMVTYEDGHMGIRDNQNGYVYQLTKNLVKLLNELHEESIRLKRDFDSCSHNWALMYDEAKEKVEELTKENCELEQKNEKLENKLWNCQNVR